VKLGDRQIRDLTLAAALIARTHLVLIFAEGSRGSADRTPTRHLKSHRMSRRAPTRS
jgi:hypothetical protein